MARFKPVKSKAKAEAGMPRAGLPCLVIVILVMALTMWLMFAVLKSS
jgi:hypothetical protein